MSNLYIGILISAMATEFYPALVQAAKDRGLMSRLLNQQTILAVTLGVPATVGMVLLAPWILLCLYSSEFIPGADLMRWLLVAMAIRFASCPLGFTLMAVGSPRLIALSELTMGAVTIALSYLLIQIFGLVGIGIAVVSANLLYVIGVIFVTRRMHVHWTPRTCWLLAETSAVLALSLAASLLMPRWWALGCGSLLVCAYMIHLAVILRRDSGIGLTQIVQKLRSLLSNKK
jgi:PST family polysaccharide transporter